MKYLPGDIYTNGMASSASEVVAYCVSGVILKFLKIRLTFALSFAIALVGGLLILFLGQKEVSWMPLFVTLAKFGISMGFCLVYVGTEELFPTLFCATAFGICNLFSRGLSIGAPQLAEVKEPYPMLIFCILTSIGIVLAFFIKTKT